MVNFSNRNANLASAKVSISIWKVDPISAVIYTYVECSLSVQYFHSSEQSL